MKKKLIAAALSLGTVCHAIAVEGCPEGMDCGRGFGGRIPSAASVVNFEQVFDKNNAAYFGVRNKTRVPRRYLRYVPKGLPPSSVPVLLLFHGANVEAETMAWHETYRDFERLADEHKFIVVYGNAYSPESIPPLEYPGIWNACLAEHRGEAPDVSYVREIVAQLDKDYRIDRSRVYAIGISNGGGMAFGMALEAPDLVAAIVAGIPKPFSPKEPGTCKPQPGHEKVAVMMLVGTEDYYLDYEKVGMERIRDQWRASTGATGEAVIDRLPDLAQGDSMSLPSSYLERYRYPAARNDGVEMWFYKMVGAGHSVPHLQWQTNFSLWPTLGKRNQDASFAELSWEFVSRQARKP